MLRNRSKISSTLLQPNSSNNPRPPPPPPPSWATRGRGRGRGRGGLSRASFSDLNGRPPEQPSSVLQIKTSPAPLRRPQESTLRWAFNDDNNNNKVQAKDSSTLAVKSSSIQLMLPMNGHNDERNQPKKDSVKDFPKVPSPLPAKAPMKRPIDIDKNTGSEEIIASNVVPEKEIEMPKRPSSRMSGKMSPTKQGLMQFARPFPHSKEKYFPATCRFEIKNLKWPIGLAVLPISKKIIIAETKDEHKSVKMYSPEGNYLKTLAPGDPFVRPTDMAAFANDNFVVKDRNDLKVFDGEGNLQKVIRNRSFKSLFGCTIDNNDQIYVINAKENIIYVVDKTKDDDDNIVKEIELNDVIQDKSRSKCRFLHYGNNRLYIADLGLDTVYVMNWKKGLPQVVKFGKTGKEADGFHDPAGLACDAFGNIIINDAGNKAIKVFDKSYNFVGLLRLKNTNLARPSSLVMNNDDLYILNLKSGTMAKCSFEKN